MEKGLYLTMDGICCTKCLLGHFVLTVRTADHLISHRFVCRLDNPYQHSPFIRRRKILCFPIVVVYLSRSLQTINDLWIINVYL